MAPPAIDASHLPRTLQDVVQEIGLACTLALVREYGGVRLYVPIAEHIDETHNLAKVLGLAAARRLAMRWGGDSIDLPVAAAYLRAIRDQALKAAKDRSASELARDFHTTRRHVFRLKAKSEPARDQDDLFGK